MSSVTVRFYKTSYKYSRDMLNSGNRLKKIRKALNLSQEELGEKVELSRAGVAAFEANKNNFSQATLYKLYKILNINLNYLIVGEGDMFNTPKFEDVQDEFEARVIEIMKKQGLVK